MRKSIIFVLICMGTVFVAQAAKRFDKVKRSDMIAEESDVVAVSNDVVAVTSSTNGPSQFLKLDENGKINAISIYSIYVVFSGAESDSE